MNAPAIVNASSAVDAKQRLPAIDALRGCALVGMFAFHLTWDLGFFRLIPPAFPFSPPFMMFGHVVAITFLALVGASLVLASRGGMNWRAYVRRLGMIIAAAAAITVGTIYLFPDSFIFFGILHCIAVASVVALLFLRAPPWLSLLVAMVMALAPFVLASASFNTYFGWSLGLSAHEPRSNDWRPLLPWGAATIAGLGLMRAGLDRGLPDWLTQWRARGHAGRALVWGGRHSLLVYLIHQPVFLGLVYLAAMAFGPPEAPPIPEDVAFQENCVKACVSPKAEVATCQKLCACVADRAHEIGVWRPLMDGRLTPAQRATVDRLALQCAPLQ